MKVSADVIQVLENVFDDVRTDYSGRGMYGATCVGVVVTDVFELGEGLEEALHVYEDDDEVVELVEYMQEHRPSTDSMAFNTIVYWPGLSVED